MICTRGDCPYQCFGGYVEAENTRLKAKEYSDTELNLLDFQAVITERDTLIQHKDEIRAVVDEQAEDEGLWFVAETVTEAHLQAALRRLHAVVEGEVK